MYLFITESIEASCSETGWVRLIFARLFN